MGQKVHPLAFRLNVQHHGLESLLFRPEERKERCPGDDALLKGSSSRWNPTGSPDRLGEDHEFRGSMTSTEYGQALSLVLERSSAREERAISHGRLLNRATSLLNSSPDGTRCQWSLERRSLNGEPMNASIRHRWSLSLTRLASMTEEAYAGPGASLQREWNTRDLMSLVSSSDLWASEVDQAMTRANLTNDLRRRSRMDPSLFLPRSSSGKGGRKGTRPLLPVLLKGRRRAGVHPVSPVLARLLVLMLEEAESQTKLLMDVRRLLDVASSSPILGLLRSMIETETKGEDGLSRSSSVVLQRRQGGYRGCRLRVKGTLDGSRRTRKEVFQRGILPLSTRSVPRCFAHRQAKTKHGTLGVQVIYAY